MANLNSGTRDTHTTNTTALEIAEIAQQDSLLNPTADEIPELYPETGVSRQPARWKQVIHQLTKRKVKTFVYKYRWPLFFGLSFLIASLVVFAYRREFFQALETLSHKLSDMGYSGYILMASLIFLSAFPPVIGYGTYQTLCGYTFGFQIGFPISYCSALLGAVVCFQLSRSFLKARVVRMLANYSNLETVVKAVEKKGFTLFLLIRLSPYPFNLLNVLFAATDIKLSHFAVGTALSLLKIALHVYIGANLTSFAKHVLGEDEDMSEDELRIENIKYVAMMFFSIIAFVVMAYLYRVAKAAVAEANNLDEEQMSFLNHHDEEVGFLDDDDSEDENNNAKSTPVNLDVHTTSNTAVATDNQLHMNETRDNISLDNWDNWGDDDSDSDVAEQVIPLNQKLKKEGLGKSD